VKPGRHRARLSTVVLAGAFVVMLVVYGLIRPTPAAKPTPSIVGVVTTPPLEHGPRSPRTAPTSSPRASNHNSVPACDLGPP
jgi:hypothetical protein